MAYEAVIFNTTGEGIKVTATATAGTSIYTSHATSIDEIALYAWNSNTVAQLLTLEIGGVTDPDNIIEVELEPNTAGLQCVLPSIRLTGSTNIAAFGPDCASEEIIIFCEINRIT